MRVSAARPRSDTHSAKLNESERVDDVCQFRRLSVGDMRPKTEAKCLLRVIPWHSRGVYKTPRTLFRVQIAAPVSMPIPLPYLFTRRTKTKATAEFPEIWGPNPTGKTERSLKGLAECQQCCTRSKARVSSPPFNPCLYCQCPAPLALPGGRWAVARARGRLKNPAGGARSAQARDDIENEVALLPLLLALNRGSPRHPAPPHSAPLRIRLRPTRTNLPEAADGSAL